MLIVEELHLLLLRPDGRTESAVGASRLFGEIAAVIVDLALHDRVVVTTERKPVVHVLSAEPTGHPVLDAALARILPLSGKRLDALIVRSVPRAKKAVKWNSPFYGLEGKGWFLSMHAFAKYMKLAFFRGTSLKPPPPGESTSKDVRYLDIREGDELDEAQLVKWLKQAAKLPGWNP